MKIRIKAQDVKIPVNNHKNKFITSEIVKILKNEGVTITNDMHVSRYTPEDVAHNYEDIEEGVMLVMDDNDEVKMTIRGKLNWSFSYDIVSRFGETGWYLLVFKDDDDETSRIIELRERRRQNMNDRDASRRSRKRSVKSYLQDLNDEILKIMAYDAENIAMTSIKKGDYVFLNNKVVKIENVEKIKDIYKFTFRAVANDKILTIKYSLNDGDRFFSNVSEYANNLPDWISLARKFNQHARNTTHADFLLNNINETFLSRITPHIDRIVEHFDTLTKLVKSNYAYSGNFAEKSLKEYTKSIRQKNYNPLFGPLTYTDKSGYDVDLKKYFRQKVANIKGIPDSVVKRAEDLIDKYNEKRFEYQIEYDNAVKENDKSLVEQSYMQLNWFKPEQVYQTITKITQENVYNDLDSSEYVGEYEANMILNTLESKINDY